MSSTGIHHTYIPPVDQKDPQSLDNASRDFLDVLQSDQRLAQTRERERDQQRKRGGQIPVADGKPRTATPPGAPAQAGRSDASASQTAAGPLVALRPDDAAASPDVDQPGVEPPLVAGQRPARSGATAAARLPTGVAQQPPSAGLGRAPLAGGATVSPAGQQPSGQQGAGPLALVDARTLAALASGIAASQPAGRLVGPMGTAAPAAPLPGLGGETEKPALVGPPARPGLAPGQRPPPPATLSATTPVEVRERIQLWMLTGVLNTAPVRFPAIDPLATGEGPALRQGVPRATTVSPLARGVSARPLSAPPLDLAAANDGPGLARPLAANDGMPPLGQAMVQDHARRGGGAGPLSPPAPPSPGPAQQVRSAGGRDGRPEADRGLRGGAASRPLDFARAEREAQARGRDPQAPARLDIPGLGLPRV